MKAPPRGGGKPDFDRPQRIHTQPGAPDFHKLRFPGLFPPFLTKEETKQLGSDDFSGPRTSRQWRFVPRRAILLAHHQAKSRLRISSTEQPPKGPRETKSPALGRSLFWEGRTWLATPWYFASASQRESDSSRVRRCRGVLRMPPGAFIPKSRRLRPN